MGSAFDLVCESCVKERENNLRNSYFINESSSTPPQALIDIKVNAKNFVVQRTKNVFDVY